MKICRTLALAISLALAGAAHIGAAYAEPAPSVVTMKLTQSDFGGGRIYLPMRFANMMGTMRLDTGASTTRVALAPWNKDLPVLAQSDSIGASGQSVRCDDVEAQNVGLKASQGNDIARAKYEVSRCASNSGDDLLGLDFFRKTRFTLDFGKGEMVFFGEAAPAAKPFHILGAEKRLVGVDLKIGNMNATGLFDTGAEVCAVDLGFVLKHRRLFAPVKKSRTSASEAGGRTFSSRMYRIKEINLGDGRVAHDVYALAYDFGVLRGVLGPGAPLILGYNLLSKFNWTLDFTAPDKPMWSATGK